jgi:hypothetical protein
VRVRDERGVHDVACAGNPKSLEFLRMDCSNVLSFFGKSGVAVPSVMKLYQFIVDDSFADSEVESRLQEVRWRPMSCAVRVCAWEHLSLCRCSLRRAPAVCRCRC